MRCPFCRQKKNPRDKSDLPCCSGAIVKPMGSSTKVHGRKNQHRTKIQQQVKLGLQSKFTKMMKRLAPKDPDAKPDENTEVASV